MRAIRDALTTTSRRRPKFLEVFGAYRRWHKAIDARSKSLFDEKERAYDEWFYFVLPRGKWGTPEENRRAKMLEAKWRKLRWKYRARQLLLLPLRLLP